MRGKVYWIIIPLSIIVAGLSGTFHLVIGEKRADTKSGQHWVESAARPKPPVLYDYAMAYDSDRKMIVLFSGGSGYPHCQDTWEWDGNNWAKKDTPNKPLDRRGHAMVYDSARKVMVMFGGSKDYSPTKHTALDDTWEYDGNKWKERKTSFKPPPMKYHAMAYDSARKKTVLFGGIPAGAVDANATYEYDGSNWKKLAPKDKPATRCHHGMIYDSARKRIVLFGGRSGPKLVNDTWEWDGTNWALRSQSSGPGPRNDFAMAYDTSRHKIILFGGASEESSGTFLQDTWEYDGKSWRKIDTADAPRPRYGHKMVYDSAGERCILFGGMTKTGKDSCWVTDEMWEYSGD